MGRWTLPERTIGAASLVQEAVPVATFQRASSNDLMELVAESGSAPMQVAAVLVLAGAPDPATVRAVLDERIRAVPRLRQRLLRTPFGCGRPVWVDDPRFRIEDHIHVRQCPSAGDEPRCCTLQRRRCSTGCR